MRQVSFPGASSTCTQPCATGAYRVALLTAVVAIFVFCAGLKATASAPATNVTPSSGPPTTTTLVSGNGFDPNAHIEIYFDTSDLISSTTNSSGAFSNIALQVPSSAVPGSHWITVLERPAKMARASFLVRTDWAQNGFDNTKASNNPYENVLSPANVGRLALRWSYHASQEWVASPTVALGTVFAGFYGGSLYALNAADGTLGWVNPDDVLQSSPAVSNGVVYVDDGSLCALNAATGTSLWCSSVGYQGGDLPAGPTVANGMVYVGSNDGRFRAFNANTGALVWVYDTGGYIYSSAAVVNGIVYFGSWDDNLYALNANTGTLIWKFAANNYINASPAVVNGVVYFTSWDGNAYALDAGTGALLWSYGFAAPYGGLVSSVAVANGMVYVSGQNLHFVYALDARTGSLLWRFANANPVAGLSSPSVANGVLYVGSLDGNIFAVNASTGAPLWSHNLGGHVWSAPTVVNGMLFTGSDMNGMFYAFGLPSN